MTIDEMKKIKKERGYSFEKLSSMSGVPVSTIQKIWGGKTKVPREETIEALTSVLANPLQDKRQGQFTMDDYYALNGDEYHPIELVDGKIYGIQKPYAHMVQEGNAVYRTDLPETKHMKYTAADLSRVRSERNVELIDGVFYDMAAPSGVHQTIELEILFDLNECIRQSDQHKKNCTAMGPRDVQLFPDDDKNIYIPDVVVLCNQEKEHNNRIIGAPDLVMEILSPSTASKDKTIKMRGYERAGVREVWLINPKTRQILIHDFEHDDRVSLYGFTDLVPVGISDGTCSVDFARISGRLDTVFGKDWE